MNQAKSEPKGGPADKSMSSLGSFGSFRAEWGENSETTYTGLRLWREEQVRAIALEPAR